MLEIIDDGPKSAQDNMDEDLCLLDSLNEKSPPLLRFYKWKKPSITYGYFIKAQNLIDLDKIKKFDIDIGRRPTGGGIVFHMWDLAFSFIMPAHHQYFFLNPLKNYEFVNSIVKSALLDLKKDFIEAVLKKKEDLGEAVDFCMGHSTKFDVLIGGRKVAGAAQRRKKTGYLHQGMISLYKPDIGLLNEILLKNVSSIISRNSYYLFEEKDEAGGKNLQNQLVRNFQKRLC